MLPYRSSCVSPVFWCIWTVLVCTISLIAPSVGSARITEDVFQSSHDDWYNWPSSDIVEILDAVKNSRNHEISSALLFRSFNVTPNIKPNSIEPYLQLKKRYLQDVEYNKQYENSISEAIHYEITSYTQFAFDPIRVDFQETPLCISIVQKIEMKNLLLEEVTILGVSAETANFMGYVPKETFLGPGEIAVIDILFLPRVLGFVEDFLTVETSAGRYSFHVQGIGSHNPFLLSPLIRKKIATHRSYTPAIELFNPYPEILQIVKVFTSGGFLNLPDQGDTPVEFWQVNPYENRSIIRLSFLSPSANNFHGLVNILTHNGVLLTLPVEIGVVQGDLTSIPGAIQFDTHTEEKHISFRDISILNSQTYPVLVTSVQTSKIDSSLAIEFEPIILAPGTNTHIAKVTHTCLSERDYQGTIKVFTNDTDTYFAELSIPYYGTSIWGKIDFRKNEIGFHMKSYSSPETKTIHVVSHFELPLLIYSAEIISDHFRIVSCDPFSVMEPGVLFTGITVQSNGQMPDLVPADDYAIKLMTNCTSFIIPLVPYHGKLEYSVLDQPMESSRVEFGILALNELSLRIVNISNPNPVEVNISNIVLAISRVKARLEGIYDAFGEKHIADVQNISFTLPPGYHAIFILQVMCISEEQDAGTMTFEYNTIETLDIPLSYHCLKGSLNLQPGILQFSASFPGRVDHRSITAKSTYSKPVSVESITSSDPRIIPIAKNVTIQPNRRMEIALVYFSPSHCPPAENYMVSLSSEGLTPSLGETHNLQIDRRNLANRDAIWKRIVDTKKDLIEGSLTIHTNIVSGHMISFKAPLARPSIIRESSYRFLLTQIGSTSEMMVPLTNPANVAIRVELYFLDAPDEFLISPKAESAFVLPARSTMMIGPIYFLPSRAEELSASLFLKNNLTILENINLHGRGGSGRFVFTNSTRQDSSVIRSRDSMDALSFVLNEDDMKGCMNDVYGEVLPTQTFVGLNKGNLPVVVYGMSINHGSCQEYGFSIHPCGPFKLDPSEEILLSVSFAPDFASSFVERSLVVNTAQGEIIFPLRAEMPYEWLSICTDAQELSPFQQTLRQASIFFSLILFIVFFVIILQEIYVSPDPATGTVPVDHRAFLDPLPYSFDVDSISTSHSSNTPEDSEFILEIDEFVRNLPCTLPPSPNPSHRAREEIPTSSQSEEVQKVEENKKEEKVASPVELELKEQKKMEGKIKPEKEEEEKKKKEVEEAKILLQKIKKAKEKERKEEMVTRKKAEEEEAKKKQEEEKVKELALRKKAEREKKRIEQEEINRKRKEARKAKREEIAAAKKKEKARQLAAKKEKERKFELRKEEERVKELNRKLIKSPPILLRRRKNSESGIGIGMLRSDGDSLFNEELFNTPPGVIGRKSPTRPMAPIGRPFGAPIGRPLAPTPTPLTPVSALDSLFSRNAFTFSSDSIFNMNPGPVVPIPAQPPKQLSPNVRSQPSSPNQEKKEFESVYQLF